MLTEKFEKDFRIDITSGRTWPNYYEEHLHDGFEMYFLLFGNINYKIKDDVYNVNRECIVWVPTNTPHKTRPCGNECYKRILFYIKPHYIESLFTKYPSVKEFADNVHVLTLSQSDLTFLRKIIDIISDLYFNDRENSEYVIAGLLFSMICYMKKISEKMQNKFEVATGKKKSSSKEVNKLMSYIDNHYFEELDLDILSQQVNLSPTYVSSLFKKHIGFTFKEYLLNKRIDESMQLLKNTNDNIELIAKKCGFNSSNHFCKAFKKLNGISPATYRNFCISNN